VESLGNRKVRIFLSAADGAEVTHGTAKI
jgi:hypothetical protein